ncbi:BrxA family protein (plasmid) [Coraliomargarita sp. W4R53]
MSRYRLSFTTGGLFVNEISLASERIIRSSSIEAAEADLLTARTFAGRTDRSIKITTREVFDRARELTDTELSLAANGESADRSNLAWLAATRRFTFIERFARDVLREKFIGLDLRLERDDFERFWLGQSQWHQEVTSAAPSTKEKLRQTLFKMLREGDYLASDGTIQSAYLSQAFIETVHPRTSHDLEIFPIHTATAQELIAR